MNITNGREYLYREKDRQCHTEDVNPGLGSVEGQSISTRNDSHSIFYPNSEGRHQVRPRTSIGGQTTPGGIHRRLKELHEACLRLIESQQQQLETSLQESKQLTAEMQSLQSLLAETLDDIPSHE
ncbi:MAG: hypothetical protein AB3A66_21715 [Nodularia sp. CChRGM 3473]